MLKRSFAGCAMGLSLSLLLSACTVDAQVAAQLLKALQTSSKTSAKTATAQAKASTQVSGNALETDADQNVQTQLLQVACGEPAMRVASESASRTEPAEAESADDVQASADTASAEPADEAQASADTQSDDHEAQAATGTDSAQQPTVPHPTAAGTLSPAQALARADKVQPLVVAAPDPIAPPGQARVSRVKIDARLQGELKQIDQMRGPERQRYYQGIQQRHPEMRNTWPVPVRIRGQVGHPEPVVRIIFVQMPQPRLAPPPMPGTGFVRPRVSVSAQALLDGLGDLPCQAVPEDSES